MNRNLIWLQKWSLAGIVMLIMSLSLLEANGQVLSCPPDVDPVYPKNADIIITTYHSHMALGQNTFFTWGEDMAGDGSNQLAMTSITPANGYGYTGNLIMYAVSGNSDAQAFLLTTTGLWVWGGLGEVINAPLATGAGIATMPLPPGVTPADVFELKANSDILMLVTTTGEVWVAGTIATLVAGTGAGGSTAANTWHQVLETGGGPLTNVVEITGSREMMFVLKSDGTMWTWGQLVPLAGGAAATTLTEATQMDLTAIPGGVTISQIGTYLDNGGSSGGVLVLGSDGMVYGVGWDSPGDIISNTGGGFISDWTVIEASAGVPLTNVVFLSTSENSEQYASAAVIVTTGGTNNLLTWGDADSDNIGHPAGLVQYPTFPNGFTVGVDNPVYTSVGGHATSYINSNSGGQVCFVGHVTDGSGAGLQDPAAPENFMCFGADHPSWPPDVQLCIQSLQLMVDTVCNTTLADTFTVNTDPGAAAYNWYMANGSTTSFVVLPGDTSAVVDWSTSPNVGGMDTLCVARVSIDTICFANFVQDCFADLELTKTISPATADLGDTVTYIITVNNLGPDDATGVQVTDPLPGGVTYVTDFTGSGTYDPVTGLWDIGSIANGGQATLTIDVSIQDFGDATNVAEVTASDNQDPDSTPDNDDGTQSEDDEDNAAPAQAMADLYIEKTVDVGAGGSVEIGDNVVYTITLYNAGPDGATNILVNDLLPAGLTYVSDNALAMGTNYDPALGDWTIPAVTAGSSISFDITATTTQLGPINNTATLQGGDQPDPNPDNDADVDDSVDINVVCGITYEPMGYGGTGTQMNNGTGQSSGGR